MYNVCHKRAVQGSEAPRSGIQPMLQKDVLCCVTRVANIQTQIIRNESKLPAPTITSIRGLKEVYVQNVETLDGVTM